MLFRVLEVQVCKAVWLGVRFVLLIGVCLLCSAAFWVFLSPCRLRFRVSVAAVLVGVVIGANSSPTCWLRFSRLGCRCLPPCDWCLLLLFAGLVS
ncbi:hypothetical protein P8452_46513 [Trifolium repens]|nr:hypothetical protein P8452_46513 [Trifolium repens]